jgi:hypothetical protein
MDLASNRLLRCRLKGGWLYVTGSQIKAVPPKGIRWHEVVAGTGSGQPSAGKTRKNRFITMMTVVIRI